MTESSSISAVKQEFIKEAFKEMDTDEGNAVSIKSFKEELLDKDDRPIGSFVGGNWMHSREVYSLLEPITSRVITDIHLTDDDISMKAIESASAAAQAWSDLSFCERSRHLLDIIVGIEKKKSLFASTLARTSKLSSLEASECVSFLIQCLNHFSSFTIVNEATKKLKPFGVVFIISSRDVFQMYWHICAALAFGNVVVLEVDAQECLLPLMFAVIMCRCGIPAGVFNVLPYRPSSIVDFSQLNVLKNTKVFLDGPSEQYMDMLNSCKSVDVDWTLLTVSNPAIVIFEDSDVDSAVNLCLDSIRSGKFRSAACIFVHESVCKTFCDAMELYFDNLEINGNLVISGTKTEIQLTLGDSMHCVPLIKFRSAKEAVDLCNAEKYEAVSIWCERLSLSIELTKKVEARVIWINGIGAYHPASFCDKAINGSNFLSVFYFMRREMIQRECGPDTDSVQTENCHSHKVACRKTYTFFYGGVFNDPKVDAFKFIRNHENKPIFCVPDACEKDVVDAISSAVNGKSKWKSQGLFDRSQQLIEFAEKLEGKRKDFADALKCINNRNYEDCLIEIQSAVQKIRYWAAYCFQLNGCMEQTQPHGTILQYLKPSGVIAIVCPEEYPLLSFVSLFAAAIALGNVVVMLPSITCPAPAFIVCEVLGSCNISAGVVNVIYSSDRSTVRSLIKHEAVNSIWLPKNLNSDKKIKLDLSQTSKHSYFYSYSDSEWNSTDDIISREFTFHAMSSKVVWLPHGDTFP